MYNPSHLSVSYWLTPRHRVEKCHLYLQERMACVEAVDRHWNNQMTEMRIMYLSWWHGVRDEEEEEEGGTYFHITAVHTFCECTQQLSLVHKLIGSIAWQSLFTVHQQQGEGASITLLQHRMLGCAPCDPAVAFSIDMLKLYHRLHSRNGQLSLQVMAKVLCDLHDLSIIVCSIIIFHLPTSHAVHIPPKPLWPAVNRLWCLLQNVQHNINNELNQNTPNWRALNACPPCNYEVRRIYLI